MECLDGKTYKYKKMHAFLCYNTVNMYLRIVVLFYLCCLRFLINAQDAKNVTINEIEILNATIFVAGNFSTDENTTGNLTVAPETERIIQPIEPLHQAPQRSLPVQIRLNNEQRKKQFLDFKPSPLLETSYDIPILPGYPESKFSFKHGELRERSPWIEKPSTEPTWNHKVVFPTNKPPTTQIINDRPYQFVQPNHQNNNQPIYPPNYVNNNIAEDIGLQPPARGDPNQRDSYQPQMFGEVDKFENQEVITNNFKEYPEFELQEKPHSLEPAFPWKKIVKLLTTFVPIGILMSALIPNVINISPINNTQNRARFDENESRTKMQLIYSSKAASTLNRKTCEQRILCELLLNAGYTRNSEENAQHLLESYVEQEEEIVEKTEELKKIMAAVSTGSCEEFRCKAFREYNNSN